MRRFALHSGLVASVVSLIGVTFAGPYLIYLIYQGSIRDNGWFPIIVVGSLVTFCIHLGLVALFVTALDLSPARNRQLRQAPSAAR